MRRWLSALKLKKTDDLSFLFKYILLMLSVLCEYFKSDLTELKVNCTELMPFSSKVKEILHKRKRLSGGECRYLHPDNIKTFKSFSF